MFATKREGGEQVTYGRITHQSSGVGELDNVDVPKGMSIWKNSRTSVTQTGRPDSLVTPG